MREDPPPVMKKPAICRKLPVNEKLCDFRKWVMHGGREIRFDADVGVGPQTRTEQSRYGKRASIGRQATV
jgi:hypothetical protein